MSSCVRRGVVGSAEGREEVVTHQSRAGGMSVHTSPLAGLLCVSNKVPYLHTSRVSMEIQVRTCQKRGLSDC